MSKGKYDKYIVQVVLIRPQMELLFLNKFGTVISRIRLDMFGELFKQIGLGILKLKERN